ALPSAATGRPPCVPSNPYRFDCIGEFATSIAVGPTPISREGVAQALFERQGRGAKQPLRVAEKQRIIAMVCSLPPQGQARWTVSLIAAEAVKRKLVAQVGRETIRVLLRDHELKPWREKMWCVAELDAEYLRKMEDVLAYMKSPTDQMNQW